MALTIVTLTV